MVLLHVFQQDMVICRAFEFNSYQCGSGFLIVFLNIFEPGNIV